MDPIDSPMDETLVDDHGIPIKRRNLEAWMPEATREQLEMTVQLNEALLGTVLPKAFSEIEKFQWPPSVCNFAENYQLQFIHLTKVALDGFTEVTEEDDELVGEAVDGTMLNKAVTRSFWQWLEFVGRPLSIMNMLECLGRALPPEEHERFRQFSTDSLKSLQTESTRASAMAKAEIAKRAIN